MFSRAPPRSVKIWIPSEQSTSLDFNQKVVTLLLSFLRTVSDELTTFIPIYPNTLEFVPKPSRTSRTPPSVIISLERSRSATTRLENR